MRFSSFFQLPLSQRPAAVPEAPARIEEAAAAGPAASARELPADLDERVRLVGEWQLDTEW